MLGVTVKMDGRVVLSLSLSHILYSSIHFHSISLQLVSSTVPSFLWSYLSLSLSLSLLPLLFPLLTIFSPITPTSLHSFPFLPFSPCLAPFPGSFYISQFYSFIPKPTHHINEHLFSFSLSFSLSHPPST